MFKRRSYSSAEISQEPNPVIGFNSPRRTIARSVLTGMLVSAATSRRRYARRVAGPAEIFLGFDRDVGFDFFILRPNINDHAGRPF